MLTIFTHCARPDKRYKNVGIILPNPMRFTSTLGKIQTYTYETLQKNSKNVGLRAKRVSRCNRAEECVSFWGGTVQQNMRGCEDGQDFWTLGWKKSKMTIWPAWSWKLPGGQV